MVTALDVLIVPDTGKSSIETIEKKKNKNNLVMLKIEDLKGNVNFLLKRNRLTFFVQNGPNLSPT